MDINWEDTRIFLAVAESGSFSAAARRLGIGQPTVSRRIARLEDDLGKRLFWRGKEGTTLTSEGAMLLPAAEQMARWSGEFDRVSATLSQGSRELEGTVRIAAAPGVAFEVLVPFAARCREALPGIRLEVRSDVELVNLPRGQADLAIRNTVPQEPELMVLATARSEILVIAAAAYATTLPQNPTMADVDWITWSAPFEHLTPRPELEAAIPDFKPVFASNSWLCQQRAVRLGLGAMFAGRSLYSGAFDHEALVNIDLGMEPRFGSYCLVTAKSALVLPRVRAVAELMFEEIEKHSIDVERGAW